MNNFPQSFLMPSGMQGYSSPQDTLWPGYPKFSLLFPWAANLSLQGSWLFGNTLEKSRGSLCPDFSVPFVIGFPGPGPLGVGRGKHSWLLPWALEVRQIKVQLLALPLHSTRLPTSGLSFWSLSFITCEMGMVRVPNWRLLGGLSATIFVKDLAQCLATWQELHKC